MNALFAERFNVCSGFVPINMAAGAPTSDIVSLKNYNRCTILFFAAAGTGGDDPTITVTQKTAVGGTTSKAVNFTTVHKKQGTLASVGQYTKVEAAAGNTFTHADLAEQQKIILIDITGEMLDVDGGYDCVQATVADVGTNSQLGGLLYILSEPRFATDTLPSAIVD